MVTERLTLWITGMTCASCVSRIENALRESKGVIWANVNFAAQQAVVTYDPNTVAPRQLTHLVEHLGYEAPRWTAVQVTGEGTRELAEAEPRRQALSPVWPALAGLAAGLLLVGFYLGLVTVVQDWKHATELLWGDRWLVGAIAAGFGVQIGLYVHLRRLNTLHHKLGQCKALAATGTGTSSAAMVACCAHHLADVLPILGLSAAATFLNQYRVPFMLVGLATNLVGIVIMLRLIRSRHAGIQSAQTVPAAPCHAEGENTAQTSSAGADDPPANRVRAVHEAA